MSYWNYRMMKVKESGLFQIVEVYYNDQDEIEGWTDGIEPSGETEEELLEDFLYMLEALQKPLIIEEDIEIAPEERNSLHQMQKEVGEYIEKLKDGVPVEDIPGLISHEELWAELEGEKEIPDET